jgi:hypothetical protein
MMSLRTTLTAQIEGYVSSKHDRRYCHCAPCREAGECPDGKTYRCLNCGKPLEHLGLAQMLLHRGWSPFWKR